MRKLLPILLTLAAAFWPKAPLADEPARVPIGVAWFDNSKMSENIVKGMHETFRIYAPEFEMEVKPTLKDEEALMVEMERFQRSKKAMVILRSAGAEALKRFNPQIPSFIGATYDAKSLGVVEHPDAPEGHITGVVYGIPMSEHFRLFKQIFPNLKSAALFLEKGHPSSAIERQSAEALCKKQKIALEVHELTSIAQAEGLLPQIESDVIILGSQGFLINEGGTLQSKTQTPILSFPEQPVKNGALAALAADDVFLGKLLGESIIEVVRENRPINLVPIKSDPRPKLTINIRTAERLGLELPYSLLKGATLIQ